MDTLFSSGNLEIWQRAIKQNMALAIDVITDKVIPTMEAALLALLGSKDDYKRTRAVVEFHKQGNLPPYSLSCLMQYSVPTFKVQGIPDKEVAADEDFINRYLTQISEIVAKPTEIDTDEGFVVVTFSMQLGQR
jgi:hypothetical protein